MRKRQGRLFRKYAVVLAVLVGATLIASTLVLIPIGLWAYRRADRRIRRLGTINQY